MPGGVRRKVILNIGVVVEIDHHILVMALLFNGRIIVAVERFEPLIAVFLANTRGGKSNIIGCGRYPAQNKRECRLHHCLQGRHVLRYHT